MRDIESYIYASEISPSATFDLLTSQWMLGPRLSAALIARYGGHIYNLRKALYQLQRGEYRGNIDALFSSNVMKCIDWAAKNPKSKDKMWKTLEQLAVEGFVATAGAVFNDPVEEVISLNNVGGVVRLKGLVPGLSRDLTRNSLSAKTGLVPSIQEMRLAIADVLESGYGK